MSTNNPPDPSPSDRSRSSHHRSRSRSPRSSSHTHQHHHSHQSSSKRRSDSKSRSRSRSRSRDRHRHRRRHSRSRSRSASSASCSHSRSPRRHRSRSPRGHKHRRHHSPHRHQHHHQHHPSSSSSSHVKHEPGVKLEGGHHHHSSHHSTAASSSIAASASKPEPVKFESALARLAPQRPSSTASGSGTASSSFHNGTSAAAATTAKLENEPSARDIERMLEASAAQHREETQMAPTNLEHINYKREKIEKAMAAKNAAPEKKAEANFGLSGLLAADANKDSGAIASDKAYREPPDARLPSQDAQWRLYVFKGKETVGPPLHLAKQSMFMIGRDEPTVDILIAHASCSKHHAVIQFRQKEVIGPEGNVTYPVKPYLMDLGSTNGTKIMGVKRDANKYYELLENDLIQFGYSTRDYVLLNAANKK